MACVGSVRAALMSVSAPSATSETNTALSMRSPDTQHQTLRGQWRIKGFDGRGHFRLYWSFFKKKSPI